MKPVDRGARRRRLGAERARRCRRRQRNGIACYRVEVGARVLDMIVRLGWLGDDEAGDAREVGRAIAALLADAAKNL